jgi:hypothetical protein
MNYKVAVFTIGLLFSGGVVSAAQVSDNPPQGDQQMIVVNDASKLLAALTELTSLHDGDIGNKCGKVLYDFGDSDARGSMIADMNILKNFMANVQEEARQLQSAEEQKNGGPLKTIPAVLDKDGKVVTQEQLSPAQIELNDKISKLTFVKRPIAKLFRIKMKDLNVGTKEHQNAISGDTVSNAEPVVDFN